MAIINTRPVVLQVDKLNKSFGTRHILRDVDLTLHHSENLVILGESGMGKSVLIKCIIGLIMPDSGSINILGDDVLSLNAKELNELRRHVGFSFQGSALYDSMSIRDNLTFALKRNHGVTNAEELEHMVRGALRDVGLERAIDQMPSELSGGMRKRIGIARCLILKPKIMLYDEPTAGLDPVTSSEINDLILEVKHKYDTASILITHDITCAKSTADRLMYMQNGSCHLEGSFEELKHQNDPHLNTFFDYFNIRRQ